VVKPTLFCSGIPGAGKTILAAATIRNLLTTRAEHGHYVAFVFCNYRMQEEQTVETLIAAILRQVIEQCPLLPDSARKMYASYKLNKASPSSSDMLARLCSISWDNPRLFVVIDALDECLDSVWKPLIRSMRQLQQEAGSSLMVTSRPNEVRRREFSEDIQLDIRARDGDIESFLHGQLGGLSDCVVEDTTLQASIVKQITQLADGM
jgi:tRNA uridine 5-carbamoylmethylation protein Kti12